MKTFALLILFVVLSTGCSCGHKTLTASESAQICVTLQTCFPQEWTTGIFGATLSDCASRSSALLPLPSSVGTSPVLATGMEPYLHDIYLCLLDAKANCGAASVCWGAADPTADAGFCVPQSLQQGTCSVNNALSGCTADAFQFLLDCSQYGGSCGLQSAGPTSFDVCIDTMCQGGALPACRGNVAEKCNSNVVYGLLDCAAQGGKCQTDPDAGAYCSGPACAGSEPSCEGSVAVTCVAGTQLKVDCSRGPTFKRCDQGTCVETNTACTVGTAATCSGKSVQLCQDGAMASVDCSALGFSTCTTDRCAQ